MTVFLQYLVNGLSMGSVYAIIALGYTCLLYTSLPLDAHFLTCDTT